jgi:hypothetical protein
MFHPKHTKDSQALKNIAEFVIRCMEVVATDGYPEWFVEILPTV